MNFLKSKGMSLFEVLIALAVFSFLFVVITQIVEQNYRQTKKIQTDIRQKTSFDNVTELIKTDFSSVSFFLDVNANFMMYFPLPTEEKNLTNSQKNAVKAPKSNPVFFNSSFVFRGAEDEVEFVSYTFSEGEPDRQWLSVRYYVEDCPGVKNPSSCLIRSSRRFWGESDPIENELVVLRGFQSLELSYSSSYEMEKDWQDEWKSLPNSLSFPSYVQMRVKKQEEDAVWIFPVSQSHLMRWNPYAKEWTRWPKLEAEGEKNNKESVSRG